MQAYELLIGGGGSHFGVDDREWVGHNATLPIRPSDSL